MADEQQRRIRIPRGARIGRFPVMALLQAARYYLLYGDLERAKSFGLNRAIFYAWAKYYGPQTGHYMLRGRRSPPVPPRVREEMEKVRREAASITRFSGGRVERIRVVEDEEGRKWAILFDGYEAVPVGPHGWFAMGGQEQTPRDFDRQVAKSFEAVGIPFEVAWKAALEYVKRFPTEVLKSPSRFYKYVYEPVRDSFVESVIRPYVEGGGEAEKRGEAVEEKRGERAERVEKRGGSAPRGFRTLDEFLGRRDAQ